DREEGILLRYEPARPENPWLAPVELGDWVHYLGVELGESIDPGRDHVDARTSDVVVEHRIGELLARHRKGVDQITVAGGGVANVTRAVVLLGMELNDKDRRVAKACHVGHEIEGQTGVHDVHHLNLSRLDE